MALPDAWTGPGGTTGNTYVAPDVCWFVQLSGSTVGGRAQFFNSSNSLVTSSGTFQIWDVTAGTPGFQQSFSGANTVNLSSTPSPNAHVYALAINYSASVPDHCVLTVTSMSGTEGTNWRNYFVLRVRRSGAWVGVSGNMLRIRRSGAWVPAYIPKSASNTNGVLVRRSNAWVKPGNG